MTTEDFSGGTALAIDLAARRTTETVAVRAGQLHLAVGSYSTNDHRMPVAAM